MSPCPALMEKALSSPACHTYRAVRRARERRRKLEVAHTGLSHKAQSSTPQACHAIPHNPVSRPSFPGFPRVCALFLCTSTYHLCG